MGTKPKFNNQSLCSIFFFFPRPVLASRSPSPVASFLVISESSEKNKNYPGNTIVAGKLIGKVYKHP